MPLNLKLVCAYDGTRYYGWQKTAAGPSIEEELERVLEQILQQKVSLSAASRTDRGVHAMEQVVSFHAARLPSLISLNQLLPKDIQVTALSEAPADFHATLSAKGKLYRYNLSCAPFSDSPKKVLRMALPLPP